MSDRDIHFELIDKIWRELRIPVLSTALSIAAIFPAFSENASSAGRSSVVHSMWGWGAVIQNGAATDWLSIFIGTYTLAVLSLITATVLLPPSRANVAISTTMAILCGCLGLGRLLVVAVAKSTTGAAPVQAPYFVCALMSLILAALWGIRAADRRSSRKSRR